MAGSSAVGGVEADDRAAVARLVDRYLRHLAIELGRSRHTIAAYRRDLRVYERWLAVEGLASLAAVTRADLERYAITLRESGSLLGAEAGPAPDGEPAVETARRPLAPASIGRMLSSVRGLHRFAVEEGMLVEDATTELRPPKPTMRLPKALTIDQVAALLDATGGEDPQRVRDRALLELLYATGARVSEIVDLDLDDWYQSDEVIRLTGKGSKQRIVPVGSMARAAMADYLVRVRPGFAAARAAGRSAPSADGHRALFLGSRGARISRQHAFLIIRETGVRAGLAVEHLSPHVLRHSFATHLLQGGADVRVVQELLGHASVATTQIYTKVTADSLRDAYLQAHPRAR